MWEEKSFLSSRFAFSSEKHAIRHCHTKEHEVESDVNNFSSLPVYEWLLRLKWIPHNSSNKCSSDKQAILDRQQFENLLSELVLFISGQLSNFRAWMNLLMFVDNNRCPSDWENCNVAKAFPTAQAQHLPSLLSMEASGCCVMWVSYELRPETQTVLDISASRIHRKACENKHKSRSLSCQTEFCLIIHQHLHSVVLAVVGFSSFSVKVHWKKSSVVTLAQAGGVLKTKANGTFFTQFIYPRRGEERFRILLCLIQFIGCKRMPIISVYWVKKKATDGESFTFAPLKGLFFSKRHQKAIRKLTLLFSFADLTDSRQGKAEKLFFFFQNYFVIWWNFLL